MHAKPLQLCLTLTLWTIAHQVPVSMRFSRQEYWSGVPFSILVDLPNPGINVSSALPGGFFTTSATWKAILWNAC